MIPTIQPKRKKVKTRETFDSSHNTLSQNSQYQPKDPNESASHEKEIDSPRRSKTKEKRKKIKS
jgi:hypothetical protein